MLLRDEGWREAMCGTISLYDKQGERLHTSYFAAPPEYGKQTFHEKMEREIARMKEKFPKATTIRRPATPKTSSCPLHRRPDQADEKKDQPSFTTNAYSQRSRLRPIRYNQAIFNKAKPFLRNAHCPFDVNNTCTENIPPIALRRSLYHPPRSWKGVSGSLANMRQVFWKPVPD